MKKSFLNKIKLGKLTYIFIALHRLFVTKPGTVTVTIDGTKNLTFSSTYFVAFMNNPYEGGGVKFCPKAKNDDDKLDVLIAANISKCKVLCLLPLALFGWHTPFKGVNILRCSHIEVHSDKALPIHTDGEPLFLQRDVSANCLPDKIRVITSRKI